MSPLAALLVLVAAAAALGVATAAALQLHELTSNISPETIAAENSSLVVPPHGCLEGGLPYIEGSPLPSAAACERCFCLGGRRRCVRPRCLAPPAACVAEPAPGACCPERYRCRHHINATTPAASHGAGDCLVGGDHVAEGESVTREKCSHCYCLRGAVHCQPIACARALLDCRPLLRPGDCCPYSYSCPPRARSTPPALTSRSRALDALTSGPMTTDRSSNDVISTHNNDTDPPVHNTPPHGAYSTIQPDGSVRVIVNGTVNCSAELAGTAPAYNGDIITEANYHDGESFIVNVTSSLRTNSSHLPSRLAAPSTAAARPTRNDFDYDYNEATLPPSLPNLKIIPFVAADAVVEREGRPPAADRRRDDIAPVYVSPPAPAPPPAPLPSPAPPVVRPVTTSPPVIGLFSPPAHIEGGFVPKGVGFEHEDQMSVGGQPQPSTPTQDPIGSMSCTTADGEIIHNGVSVTVMCEECSCQRGRLRCTARPCRSQPGCRRRPQPKLTLMLTNTSLDTYCCGELVCETEGANATTKRPENKPTSGTTPPTRYTNRTEAIPTMTTLAPTTTVSTTTTSRTTSGATTTTETSSSQTRKATSPTTTPVTRLVTKTTPIYDATETNHTSIDYSEEDEDEGFSFGNVLKLLLSDSYGTTGPTVPTTRATPFTPRSTPVTTHAPVAKPVIPISNRIDHLMLGEATSIRKTTPRPPPAPAPVPTPVADVPAAGAGGGLLPKLAGCNIYGRMYRVGRIIAELSSACAECRCTELGVQCRALHC